MTLRKGFRVVLALTTVAVLPSCAATDLLAPQPASAESFCGSLPQTGTGKWFFCASNQSNLQKAGNWGGYCMPAERNNLGLVGYSATTYSGGADTVKTFSGAQDMCNLLNSGGLRQCGSISRCTREQ